MKMICKSDLEESGNGLYLKDDEVADLLVIVKDYKDYVSSRGVDIYGDELKADWINSLYFDIRNTDPVKLDEFALNNLINAIQLYISVTRLNDCYSDNEYEYDSLYHSDLIDCFREMRDE